MRTTFEIRKLTTLPVAVATLYGTFDLAKDAPALIDRFIGVLDYSWEPIFQIADVRQVSFHIGDVVKALALAPRGRALLRHPNLCRFIAVTNKDVARFGLSTLRQAQSSGFPINVYPCVEDALIAVHWELVSRGRLATT